MRCHAVKRASLLYVSRCHMLYAAARQAAVRLCLAEIARSVCNSAVRYSAGTTRRVCDPLRLSPLASLMAPLASLMACAEQQAIHPSHQYTGPCAPSAPSPPVRPSAPAEPHSLSNCSAPPPAAHHGMPRAPPTPSPSSARREPVVTSPRSHRRIAACGTPRHAP